MMDIDLGGAPLVDAANPLIFLGFNSYCYNVVTIDTPISCLASSVLVWIHQFFHISFGFGR